MKKIIASVGFEFPGKIPEVQHILFESDSSIQFADIVIFTPEIKRLDCYNLNHQVLSERCWKNFQTYARHWLEELIDFLAQGKTVFVFFYYRKGIHEYHPYELHPADLYMSLPLGFDQAFPKSGKNITLMPSWSAFVEYWKRYEPYSYFSGALPADAVPNPVFTIKGSSDVVGAIFTNGSGCVVLLPPADFLSQLRETTGPKTESDIGRALMVDLINLDKAIRHDRETTQPPSWVNESEFSSIAEEKQRAEIARIEITISKLSEEKIQAETKLKEELNLKELLYEQGLPLEDAVRNALNILGFRTTVYDDGILRIDALFDSGEGEFLGEFEGKDHSAVDVKKFRQLEANVTAHSAKSDQGNRRQGVLFGNGFRMRHPNERTEQFTDMCQREAKRTNFALIQTVDLHRVVSYLRESNDATFAKHCREAILTQRGKIVVFPQPPIPTVVAIVPDPSVV